MNVTPLLNLTKRFKIVRLRGTFPPSVAYKDTKNKQKKMEELADRLGFVQTCLLLHRFLFLLFSSSVLLFCVSATVLSMPCRNWITVCCDLTRVWRVKERVCQLFEVCGHEFAHLSLSCEGRFSDGNTYQNDCSQDVRFQQVISWI